MPACRKIEIAVVAMLALASIATVLVLPRAAQPGLTGWYWYNSERSGPRAVDVPGATPSTTDLGKSLRPVGAGPASAEWAGFLVVEKAGAYRFVLQSTGVAAVSVGEETVASTTGGPEAPVVSGAITLAMGAHPLRARYGGTRAPHELSLLWMREGGRADVLKPEHLASARPPASRIRFGPAIRLASIAVPIIWAALLLYLPVRLIGAWMWRHVRQVTPEKQAHVALVAVLVLALGLTLWGLQWGLVGDDWAPDELRPTIIRDALSQRFAGGWHDKYPALHYMLLGLPLAAFEFAEHLPALTADTYQSYVAQFVIVRLVSTLMGLGTLIAIYLCAVELFGARRAVLAPLVLALTPLYVFYGKVANLDIPALCWFGWTLVAFLRIMRGGTRQDYILLGVAAAAAVATKDQAYASLALLPAAVLWATLSTQPHASLWRRAIGAVTDRRLLAGLAATAAASLVFHNVIFNPVGFREHVRVLSGFNDIAIVPRTLDGAVQMTWKTLDLFRISLGVPFFILAVVGIVNAWRRPDRRWWLWLLLVPLSFHLTFTCVTFFVCDRYVFGGVFVLALFAGAALGDLIGATRWHGTARAVAAAAVVISLPYAASINVMMDADARNAARAFVRGKTAGDEVVGLVGRYTPHMAPPLRMVVLESAADVVASRPAYIIVNARYAERFRNMRSPAGRDLMSALRRESFGYRVVLAYRAPLPFWALLQYEPSFAPGGEAWWTNLDKINPEVVVFERKEH